MKLVLLIVVLNGIAAFIGASRVRSGGHAYDSVGISEDFRRPIENVRRPVQGERQPFLETRKPLESDTRHVYGTRTAPADVVQRQEDYESFHSQGLRKPTEGIFGQGKLPGQTIRTRVVKKVVPIVRHILQTDHHGTFNLETETGDGIRRVETGSLKQLPNSKPVAVSAGTISWTSLEGQKFSLSYTADENGFHPTGDHLPTPPPTPEAILKMLARLPKLKSDEVPTNFEERRLRNRGQFPVHVQSIQPARTDSLGRVATLANGSPVSRREYQNGYEDHHPYNAQQSPPSSSYETSESQEVVHKPPQIPAERPSVLPPVVPTTTTAPVFFTSAAPQILSTRPPNVFTTPPPPFPTRPTHTIIEAPLVPILVGPPPVPLRNVVKTGNVLIDSDAMRTVVRIVRGRAV